MKVYRLVGEDFVVPNRMKIGGELLDINYENTYNQNKAELMKEAKVFGFAWMGDGATIHKMPLMNILALNGTTAPMTVLIHDCTKHMEEGGKKDLRRGEGQPGDARTARGGSKRQTGQTEVRNADQRRVVHC